MPSVLMQWTAHPARRRPKELALAVAVISLTAAAVLAGLGSAYLAALAVVILLIAIAPFLLPTRYTITDEGIEARRALGRRSRRFVDLRRIDVWRDAVLASPFRKRTAFDRFRGILVLLDGADRERVISLLKEKIPVQPVQPAPAQSVQP